MNSSKHGEDYDSIGEIFAAKREASQIKRAENRNSSADWLIEKQIPFQSKNFGSHLIVEGKDCFIDFWPGTGKWITRKGQKGFGVRNLINYILGEQS